MNDSVSAHTLCSLKTPKKPLNQRTGDREPPSNAFWLLSEGGSDSIIGMSHSTEFDPFLESRKKSGLLHQMALVPNPVWLIQIGWPLAKFCAEDENSSPSQVICRIKRGNASSTQPLTLDSQQMLAPPSPSLKQCSVNELFFSLLPFFRSGDIFPQTKFESRRKKTFN